MISKFWSDIELYCANGHDEPQKMELEQVGKLLYYVCPKGHSKNCDINEPVCKNRLSIVDFEKMIDYLDKMITESVQNGEELNLTNYKWKKKLLSFHIIEHGKKMKIEVLNKDELHS
jgi:hypothetical protein